MKFSFRIRTGGEVIFLGREHTRTVYYGEPEEHGRWRVDLNVLEKLINDGLRDLHFGGYVDEFYCGLEIADIEGWGNSFIKTRDYISLRPRMRAIVSVAQVDWLVVKDQSLEFQYLILLEQIVDCVERISTAKRKPAGFDASAMAKQMRNVLSQIQLNQINLESTT
ncbi:hypothetical protein [Chitinibacter sp. S2-10]|uniref:hypothetical protein n=1 Tax=Chitinibacter sp. S2-10 TaxID=3373597 RepID=UPI003977C445